MLQSMANGIDLARDRLASYIAGNLCTDIAETERKSRHAVTKILRIYLPASWKHVQAALWHAKMRAGQSVTSTHTQSRSAGSLAYRRLRAVRAAGLPDDWGLRFHETWENAKIDPPIEPKPLKSVSKSVDKKLTKRVTSTNNVRKPRK